MAVCAHLRVAGGLAGDSASGLASSDAMRLRALYILTPFCQRQCPDCEAYQAFRSMRRLRWRVYTLSQTPG